MEAEAEAGVGERRLIPVQLAREGDPFLGRRHRAGGRGHDDEPIAQSAVVRDDGVDVLADLRDLRVIAADFEAGLLQPCLELLGGVGLDRSEQLRAVITDMLHPAEAGQRIFGVLVSDRINLDTEFEHNTFSFICKMKIHRTSAKALTKPAPARRATRRPATRRPRPIRRRQ